MRILSRYMLRHYIPIFSLAMVSFVGLYLVVDFFERLEPMLKRNIPFQEIYYFFLCKIPQIVTQGIPMASILAAIITLGLLKRSRELIAMEAAGINPLCYVSPILVAAMVLSFVHFGVAEFMARPLNRVLDSVWEVQVKQKKRPVWLNPENLWYHTENTIYQVRLYDRKTNTMEKATIFFLDPKFKLARRLDARRIMWTNPGWLAEDGVLVKFSGSNAQEEWFARKPLALNVSPQDFSGLETAPEDLGWLELHSYVEKIEQEGFTSTPYRVDLNQRLASPIATFVLSLLGIAIALRQGIHGGIASGVCISLAVAFAFLTVSNIGSSLAATGTLPAVLGVWAANVIFAAAVLFLWLRGYS